MSKKISQEEYDKLKKRVEILEDKIYRLREKQILQKLVIE